MTAERTPPTPAHDAMPAENGCPADNCAKVGRAALDNPDLPIEFVRDTLLALEEESEPFDQV
ncbi:hypothetical protein [Allochromatium tepidum]|uniref:Uncharacterized protein n=1 Tax=Allochromatium tepidum TaxID=553982 RepID=A0ABM7QR84_9GAMM|nr:hypothetical protein [Allochromatium tepidum]BCU08473.1 hypothetical protein Atep_31500 [Allochromatium tepidum]